MLRAFAIAMILLLTAEPAMSAIRWPWAHTHYRHARRGGVVTPTVPTATDCGAIRDAIKKMTVDALSRSIAALSPERKKVIEDCVRDENRDR